VKPTSLAAYVAVLVSSMASVACEKPSDPLGGAYGGRAELLEPTDGSFTNMDATFSEPPPPPGEGGGAPGTWSGVFQAYFAIGTIGNCPSCHAADMPTPSASYTWLAGQSYVGGPTPALTSLGSSCLSWYGGDMPPGGPSSDQGADAALTAWVSAGALNN